MHEPTHKPTHKPTNELMLEPTHEPTNEPKHEPTHEPTNENKNVAIEKEATITEIEVHLDTSSETIQSAVEPITVLDEPNQK